MISHYKAADSALVNLRKVRNQLDEVTTTLEKQIDLIPITDGIKDELGENVNDYLEEIKKNLKKQSDELESTLIKRSSILMKAREDDQREEMERLSRLQSNVQNQNKPENNLLDNMQNKIEFPNILGRRNIEEYGKYVKY